MDAKSSVYRTFLWFLVSLLLVLSNSYGASSSAKLTAEDVESFLDGLMPLQLQTQDIAGAIVVVVKDGKVLFSKGYGFADVKKRKPVSPDQTLFRPGSVSKLFTWTAVMQLVEQGKLDLDRDVNEYLDFKIPSKNSKPITMRNLMTHTPGFEETAKDLFVAKAQDLQPLSKYLPLHIPNRMFPSGETSAYSNYGTTVAGYIVQRISGHPHAEYIQEFIFKPLNMRHSTFVQPLPKELQPLMSQGYTQASAEPGSFELVNAFPAGSLSSTGMDIAQFMIAHLQQGRYGDHQIIKPETSQLMLTRQFALHPKANAMALGFYEESRNGVRILGHAGDTLYFHSDLHLIPAENVGFFVSYNSAGKGQLSARDALWEEFLNRYFPYTPPALKTDASEKQHSNQVQGLYLVSRREDSTIFRLLFRLLQLKVSAQPDGTIETDQIKHFNGKPKRWHEVEPFVYQELNGQERIFFVQRQAGVFELAIRFPFMSFRHVGFFDNSHFLRSLLIFTVVVLLLTVLFWPIAALMRRHYGKTLNLTTEEKRYRRWTRLACILILAFLIIFTVIIVVGFQSLTALSSKTDVWLRLVNILGLIAALGALFAIYNAFRAWKSRERGTWSKIGESLIALACLGFIWILVAGRLLIFNLNY